MSNNAPFPMKSSLGGRPRTSCGYHHQRHQACPNTCEGRKSHPLVPHPVVNDKFATGCQPCLNALYEQTGVTQSQTITPPSSPNPNFKPLNSPQNTNTNNNNNNNNNTSNIAVDLNSHSSNLLQFYLEKQRQIEAEENKVLSMNERLVLLKEQQEKEKTEIQLHQRVIEYKKQQQALEVERIQKYQIELETAKRQQELLRETLLLTSNLLHEKANLINHPLLDYPSVFIPPPFTEVDSTTTSSNSQRVGIGVATSSNDNLMDVFVDRMNESKTSWEMGRGKEKMPREALDNPFDPLAPSSSTKRTTSHTLKPLSVQYLINMEEDALDFDVNMDSDENRSAKSRRAAAASALGKFYLEDREDHEVEDDDEEDYY